MENIKKSTYNKKAQDKYKKTRKKFICDTSAAEGEKIKAHYTARGFSSANSYLLSLIRADMATDTPDC